MKPGILYNQMYIKRSMKKRRFSQINADLN